MLGCGLRWAGLRCDGNGGKGWFVVIFIGREAFEAAFNQASLTSRWGWRLGGFGLGFFDGLSGIMLGCCSIGATRFV